MKNINQQSCTATGCICPPAIFLFVLCAVAAVPQNCTAASRFQKPR